VNFLTPYHVLNNLTFIIIFWFVIHLLSTFRDGPKRFLATIKPFKQKFRNQISSMSINRLGKEVTGYKDGVWNHSEEHLWGTQFFVVITMPSIITSIGVLILVKLFEKSFPSNLFLSLFFLVLIIVTSFFIIPSLDELKSLLETSASSQLFWLISGLIVASIVYSLMQFLGVDEFITYGLVSFGLFVPWTKELFIKNNDTGSVAEMYQFDEW